MKTVFFALVLILVGCADQDHFEQLPDRSRTNIVDTSSPDTTDTYVPDTAVVYCEQGGWWCANGGTCAGRVCTVIPTDERLAVRCSGPVQLTFWGSRFPGQSLWSGTAAAGEVVTGTVETTAITVETTGVTCTCFEGGVATGSAYHLPKGGWGCAK